MPFSIPSRWIGDHKADTLTRTALWTQASLASFLCVCLGACADVATCVFLTWPALQSFVHTSSPFQSYGINSLLNEVLQIWILFGAKWNTKWLYLQLWSNFILSMSSYVPSLDKYVNEIIFLGWKHQALTYADKFLWMQFKIWNVSNPHNLLR